MTSTKGDIQKMKYESATIEVLQEKLAKIEFGNLCESSVDSNKHKEKSRDTEH